MKRSLSASFRTLLAAAMICTGWLALATATQPAAALPNFTVSVLDTFDPGAFPTGLVYGPEGAYWFTLGSANAIGKIAPPAAAATLSVPVPASRPYDLVIGPDQALWFTQQASGQVGRLDPITSQFQTFSLGNAVGLPSQITLGQDGALWFTEFDGNRIGRLSPDGTLTAFPLPQALSYPLGITTAPDGDLWFTEWGAYRIGRLTPEGVLTEFTIPDPISRPSAIAVGPDSVLWFTFEFGQSIGRVDPSSGVVTTFGLNTQSASVLDLAAGPDGQLWFLGVKTVGNFTASASGPTNLLETDITPIFESEGRSQIAPGPAGEMVFITANSQEVYTAEVPGAAAWRDLQIFINDLPAVLLAGGPFTVLAEIQNWSDSPASQVSLDLPLDAGITFLGLESPSGSITCNQTGETVTCPLGSLGASSSLPLAITLNAGRMSPYPAQRRVDVQVTQQEPDFQAANNRTYRAIEIVPLLEYTNDFSAGSDAHWLPGQVHQTSDGRDILGLFGNQQVTFTWDNLPPHDMMHICFDLYILGSWDGNVGLEPTGSTIFSNFIGPDLWSLYINENRALVTDFSNRPEMMQSYPAFHNERRYTAQYEAVETGDFDGEPAIIDARYRVCTRQAHTSETLVALFYGLNLNESFDEQWALDNVQVQVYYKAAFDIIYIPVITK